jgi:MFS family permease
MQTKQQATVATLLGLLLGFGLMQMGNTLQGTLLSIRGGIEGFSPVQIGAVGTGFWLGIVIGSLRAGKLVQGVGHIRAFLALGAIASTAPLLHLLIINPIAWIAARTLTGFCFAGLFCCRELAQQRRDRPDPGTDPERLRHDRAGGWDRRTAPSPCD